MVRVVGEDEGLDLVVVEHPEFVHCVLRLVDCHVAVVVLVELVECRLDVADPTNCKGDVE